MNLYIETLLWLNNQLDKIHLESVKYGELLLSCTNNVAKKFYTKKLTALEKEHEVITRKIEREKELAQEL